MNKKSRTSEATEPQTISMLIGLLYSDDGKLREQARKRLVERRKTVVPSLIGLLSDRHEQVRREAVKALGKIGGTEVADALVSCLNDDDRDVRWLASEALCALGSQALFPLLRGLISHSDSAWFREGVAHVLNALSTPETRSITLPLLSVLDDEAPLFEAPIAAHEALNALRKERETVH